MLMKKDQITCYLDRSVFEKFKKMSEKEMGLSASRALELLMRDALKGMRGLQQMRIELKAPLTKRVQKRL
jgi:hypothetical protein